MTSNTHPAVAKFRQEGVHEWQSDEGLTDATSIATILDAQVEATLALAYEQRTANLIEWYKLAEVTSPTSGISWGITDELRSQLQMEISERLDLAKEIR